MSHQHCSDYPQQVVIVIMVIVTPPFLGLLFLTPIQMAVSWLINGGDPNHLPSGKLTLLAGISPC